MSSTAGPKIASKPAAHAPAQGVGPEVAYTRWKRLQDDVGCLFARLLATRPEDHGQIIEIVNASSTPGRIASSVAQRVARLIESPEANGAVLIMPKIKTLEQLARGMLALASHDGWAVKATALNHPPCGDLVAISVTRDIPAIGGGALPSEGLLFGPFDDFPVTRRAPVSALEIFVGVPLQIDPKDGKSPSTRANLAHIKVPSLNQEQHDRLIKMSGVRRKKSLGGIEDMRAKAKVSFVITPAMADAIGCKP